MKPMAAELVMSVPTALKWAAAFIAGELIHVSSLVWTLVFFMAIDYITGLCAAVIRHEISSEVGSMGFLKKLGMILLLLAIHLAETQSNIEFRVFGMTVQIEHAAALGLSFNEFISIVENCARMGIPIPEFLVVWLLRFKKVKLRAASEEQIRQLRARE